MAVTPPTTPQPAVKSIVDTIKNNVQAQAAQKTAQFSIAPAPGLGNKVNTPDSIKTPANAPTNVTKLFDQFKQQNPNGQYAAMGRVDGVIVYPDGTTAYHAAGTQPVQGATYYSFSGNSSTVAKNQADARPYTAQTTTKQTTPNQSAQTTTTKQTTPNQPAVVNKQTTPAKLVPAPVTNKQTTPIVKEKIPFGISEEEWSKAKQEKVEISPIEKIVTPVTPKTGPITISPIEKITTPIQKVTVPTGNAGYKTLEGNIANALRGGGSLSSSNVHIGSVQKDITNALSLGTSKLTADETTALKNAQSFLNSAGAKDQNAMGRGMAIAQARTEMNKAASMLGLKQGNPITPTPSTSGSGKPIVGPLIMPKNPQSGMAYAAGTATTGTIQNKATMISSTTNKKIIL